MRSVIYWKLILVLMLFSGTSLAQEPDSSYLNIKRALEKSVSRSFDSSKCKEINSLIFAFFVSFMKDGNVEKVSLPNTQNCFRSGEENIVILVKENIDRLNISKKNLSNKFVVVIIYLIPKEKFQQSTLGIPEDWENLFKETDFRILDKKKLLYVIPIGIYPYPRTEN